ncbi:MAG: lipoyl synthase [Acidobacteriota bacterium]|nr:lipoyl synthase [Acidobacteriota bacterium]
MTNHPPDSTPSPRKPDWLKVKFPSQDGYFSVSAILREHGLNTICSSALCPNRAECWTERTATFLILGDVCTRNCGFCAVAKGVPLPPAPDEPERVAEAAASLGLRYVVVTSVTRDDLTDGGGAHFVRVIQALRSRIPGVRVETLVPDFNGEEAPLRAVLDAAPDVLAHNIETVESLYARIGRPAAGYRRSLEVLHRAKALGPSVTKSGLMIGLGETGDDLARTMADLRAAGCELLTIGQYLQPSKRHAPVARYCEPAEFESLRREALGLGFAGVESGPLVRSSYRAHKLQAGSPAAVPSQA